MPEEVMVDEMEESPEEKDLDDGFPFGVFTGFCLALTLGVGIFVTEHNVRPQKHTGPLTVTGIEYDGHTKFTRPNGETFIAIYRLPDGTIVHFDYGTKLKDLIYRDGKYEFEAAEFIKVVQ